jgi:hypothetical protein
MISERAQRAELAEGGLEERDPDQPTLLDAEVDVAPERLER